MLIALEARAILIDIEPPIKPTEPAMDEAPASAIMTEVSLAISTMFPTILIPSPILLPSM